MNDDEAPLKPTNLICKVNDSNLLGCVFHQMTD